MYTDGQRQTNDQVQITGNYEYLQNTPENGLYGI